MDSKIIKILLILILLTSTAQAVEFKGKFIQGHYIIGKTDPGAQITIDKKKIWHEQKRKPLKNFSRKVSIRSNQNTTSQKDNIETINKHNES